MSKGYRLDGAGLRVTRARFLAMKDVEANPHLSGYAKDMRYMVAAGMSCEEAAETIRNWTGRVMPVEVHDDLED